MTGFTKSVLVKKLTAVSKSRRSIRTLSEWLIHYRQHHELIVNVWFTELQKASEFKILTLMYLANDVIQNSSKKGSRFRKEFGLYMNKAFAHVAKSECQEIIKTKLMRLIKIWRARRVYDEIQIVEFRISLILIPEEPAPREERFMGVDEKTEKIVRGLEDLEQNAASTDEVVRQRIASIPVADSDFLHISKLQDRESAEHLLKEVEDAIAILYSYTGRLSVEAENRKTVSGMLEDFLASQESQLAHAETSLEEHQCHLQKVYMVRRELNSYNFRNHLSYCEKLRRSNPLIGVRKEQDENNLFQGVIEERDPWDLTRFPWDFQFPYPPDVNLGHE